MKKKTINFNFIAKPLRQLQTFIRRKLHIKQIDTVRIICKDGYVKYLDENENVIKNITAVFINENELSKKVKQKLNLCMFGCDIRIPKKNIKFEYKDSA